MKEKNLILFFLRQVPFHLPGNTKYVLDFMVFYVDGGIEFVDVKGIETPSFIAKKKMVEDLYPIEITVVKKIPKIPHSIQPHSGTDRGLDI